MTILVRQAQIACSPTLSNLKTHQREDVKKGNMGIGKSFLKSMRVISAILSP